MKVQAAFKDTEWLTDSLRSLGFSEESQLDVGLRQVYEVHGIALWSGSVFYQIVDDSNVSSWIPANYFAIVDHSLPSDWLANRLDDEVPFIIGPDFVIRNKEAYTDMVELVPSKVSQFRQRLYHRESSALPDLSSTNQTLKLEPSDETDQSNK